MTTRGGRKARRRVLKELAGVGLVSGGVRRPRRRSLSGARVTAANPPGGGRGALTDPRDAALLSLLAVAGGLGESRFSRCERWLAARRLRKPGSFLRDPADEPRHELRHHPHAAERGRLCLCRCDRTPRQRRRGVGRRDRRRVGGRLVRLRRLGWWWRRRRRPVIGRPERARRAELGV